MALSSPVHHGQAWFGGRSPLPLNPNLGTISTRPPEGYRPSYAGAYGGDFDQKDAGWGSRVYLPVLVEDALVFFGDPHAAISDGIITGTGIECSMNVRARITLLKGRVIERPIIAQGGAVHFVGVGPNVEEATEDAVPGCRLRGRANRPQPGKGLHAAEHHRRAARRHFSAPGHGDTADRPGGTVTRGWLGRRTALGPYTSAGQRLGEKRQAPVHPIIDTAMVVRELLVAMCYAKLVQPAHEAARFPAGASPARRPLQPDNAPRGL
jgi:hypothetical protein